MLHDHKIRTLAIMRDDRVYTADFYVEHGILHANVEGQKQVTACTTDAYDQTRALLESRILELAGRRRQ